MENTKVYNGQLIINEFGNGFVNASVSDNNNTNIKTIYIDKKNIGKAVSLDYVDVEIVTFNEKGYYGKIINYSLKDREFIGQYHHSYKEYHYIYCPKLTKSNLVLVLIDNNNQLNKTQWLKIKIILENEKIYGKIIKEIDDEIDLLLEENFNLSQIKLNITPQINMSVIMNSTHKDQRKLNTFTIDPTTTQDCDDAFSIEKKNNIIHIYVHISDVSIWLNPNTIKFTDIIKRGTTIYGKNKNWTMIPREYADNICSILPNKETFVITHEFVLDNNVIKLKEIYNSIIISKNKYDYNHIDNVIATQSNADNADNPLIQLYYTSLFLEKEIDEIEIQNDSKSHNLVKLWMIKVNNIMGEQIKKIYRCHPKPTEIQTKLFNNYMKKIDVQIKNRSELVNFVKKNNKNKFIQYMTKTILPKAYYSDTNIGHYGLGLSDYTHWTSPIRRSCDLIIQCIYKGYNINIDEYITYLNNSEILQDSVENFIKNYQNYKNKDNLLFANTNYIGIIIGISQTGITIYIEEFDTRYTIHISKLSKNKLVFNQTTNTLSEDLNNLVNLNDLNNKVTFNLFDKINVKIEKINFDSIEFILVD